MIKIKATKIKDVGQYMSYMTLGKINNMRPLHDRGCNEGEGASVNILVLVNHCQCWL